MEAAPGVKDYPRGIDWYYTLPRAGLIAAAIFFIYWPALHGGWIWDDDLYVRLNPIVQSPTGLWKFWCQPGSWVEYYPIEETVHWVQWHLWGAATLGYHLTNVLLQLLDCLLLWRLLARLGLRHGWVGGLLFAVHPAQVESVAMISELKNVLSLPFFLLSMIRWIEFDESRRREDYQWALFLYVLAMLCKITMAPFPVVILLYAWWKRGRVGAADLKASAPFFVVAAGLAMAGHVVGGLYVQQQNAPPENIVLGSPLDRLSNAGLILALYVARVLLVTDKLLSYPQWPVGAHLWPGLFCWMVLAALLAVFWRRRTGWGRHALLGLGFFLLMLAPFLGFTPISYMAFTWAMDHFLYLPLIGIVGLVVAAANGSEGRFPRPARRIFGGLLGLVVMLQAVESRALAVSFQSEMSFWSDIEGRNPKSWIAHNNLGQEMMKQGRTAQAVKQFQEVEQLAPRYCDGYYNLGVALDSLGRSAEARQQYLKVLALNPRDDRACLNLSQLAWQAHDQAGQEQWLTLALKLNPNNATAVVDLANLYARTNRLGQALDLYRPAVERNPEVVELHYNFGRTLFAAGRWSDAVEQLRAAVGLRPQWGEAHENLGLALARSGNMGEAVDELGRAVELSPDSRTARDELGMVLALAGRYEDSIKQLEMELKAHPDDQNAAQFLKKVQAYQAGHLGP